MIIDSHVHAGRFDRFDMPLPLLERLMKRRGIGAGIVSTVACAEYAADPAAAEVRGAPQLEGNRALLDELRRGGLPLYLSVWCRPSTETPDAALSAWIGANRDRVAGLKLHPFYSRLPLEDPRYEPYMDLAREHALPVSVHTTADELSSPGQLLALARRFPAVDFIMVHMGLLTDNEEAIRCVRDADNLYGDTTWVPLEKTEKAVRLCGEDKILFGSDAPIDGENSYAFYAPYFEKTGLSGAQTDKIMGGNARRLFRLNG